MISIVNAQKTSATSVEQVGRGACKPEISRIIAYLSQLMTELNIMKVLEVAAYNDHATALARLATKRLRVTMWYVGGVVTRSI